MEGSGNTAQIEERVKRLVAEQLRVNPSDIRPDGHFVDDYGADSLDLTELVINVEDEFRLRIPEADLKDLTTVASVVDYVAGKLHHSNG
jgi:acyl carrier protein